MKTAEKIKQLRIEKGLSQEALGKIVGVQKAAINKYETGRVINIKRSTLQKLGDALGVSPADLLDDNPLCNIAATLSDDELTLISRYRELNDEGKEKVTDYVYDLAASGRYIKSNKPEMVERA